MKCKLWGLIGLCCVLSVVKAADELPDPTVASKTYLSSLPSPIANKITNVSKDIADPTRPNENFRAALSRFDKSKPTTGTATTSPTPAALSFPDIKLLAAACAHHPAQNHAMLSVNKKSEMVGVNDIITTITNNQVFQIEVLDIQKNQVRLRLHPNNEILILR